MLIITHSIKKQSKLYTFFLFALFATHAFSQTEIRTAKTITKKDSLVRDRGYIAFFAGAGFPFGDFGSKDVNNDSAGFANRGLSLNLSAAYKFRKFFGLSLMFRNQSNPLSTDEMAHVFSKQYPSINWSVYADPWKMQSYMIGTYNTISITEVPGLTADLRFMIGAVNADSPKLLVTATKNGASLWVKQESVSALAFSFLLGFGFRYDFNNTGSILLYADYQAVKPDFSGALVTSSTGPSSSASFHQSMNIVTVSLGLGLKF